MLHKIKIEAALNGYIATVGCQTLVFNSRAEMLKECDSYLEKPEETEKRYRETALNARLLTNPIPQATCGEPATYTINYATTAAAPATAAR